VASAERIADGLRKCMQTKRLQDISVSDIAREAGIARATFYRLFDTPADVLEYSCDNFAEKIVREYRESGLSGPVESTRFILEHWMAYSDMIEVIMKSDRAGMLQSSMESHMRELASNDSNRYPDLTKDEADYINAAIFAQLTSLLIVWARHGKKESVDDLLRLYIKIHQGR